MADDDIQWGVNDVVNLIEKTVVLVTTLIRRAKTPDRVLRKITDMTQTLKEGEDAVDARVAALYDDTPTEPSED